MIDTGIGLAETDDQAGQTVFAQHTGKDARMYRILVIDDNRPITELLKAALTKMGYQVKTASGGCEGIRLFQGELFDLVITDIIMPDMDGRTVAKQIRSSDRPWTPIIGMSGTPWLLDGEFDSILPKPFGLEVLGITVAEVLSDRNNKREAS